MISPGKFLEIITYFGKPLMYRQVGVKRLEVSGVMNT
jgi:hypothetical protein